MSPNRAVAGIVVVFVFAGCWGGVPTPPGEADAAVHPDSLPAWGLSAGAPPVVPAELRLEEMDLDPHGFEPLRARYLQSMYDAPGRLGSRLFVHVQLDLAVQSGRWDGRYPARIDGLRERGLIVDWQIQNSIYNAFDRVLTDEHLGMRQRVMPGGSTVAGIVVGAVADGVHARRVADPVPDVGGASGTDEGAARVLLTHATVNVLTAPYVLSRLGFDVGAVFTLPGYALIGGPDGNGTPWLGLYEVVAVAERMIGGEPHRVTEFLSARRPADWSGASDLRTAAGRVTRIVVSDGPPYLLGREDYQLEADGRIAPVREHLHLVDWAPLPLPGADLVADSLWHIRLDSELFDLEPDRVPRVLDPSGS